MTHFLVFCNLCICKQRCVFLMIFILQPQLILAIIILFSACISAQSNKIFAITISFFKRMGLYFIIVSKSIFKYKPFKRFKVNPFIFIHTNFFHRTTTYTSYVFTNRICEGFKISIYIRINIKNVLLIYMIM